MRASFLAALVTLSLFPALATAAKPEGWMLAGSNPGAYSIDRDAAITHGGKPSGRMASIQPAVTGFGTMMQCINPTEYLGKRVRFAGYVRAKGVKNWSGLWMRVDGPEKNNSLAFDNMQDRPIKGTSEWKRYEVVLDVAKEATNICFGILTDGPGTVWLSDVEFTVVPTSVPTTSRLPVGPPPKPVNLDFTH